MKRSKKIFLVLSAIFLIMMMIIGYDLSQRTTFPGEREGSEESMEEISKSDSLEQFPEIN